MNAQFDQTGLEEGVRVILAMDQGDPPYMPGDSIAIGRSGRDGNWEYLARDGSENWVGAPQPFKLSEMPVVKDNTVSFYLQPAYVDDRLDGGLYRVCLVGSDGQVKATIDSVDGFDIQFSGIPNTGTLKDYQDEEDRLAREREEADRQAAEEAARAKEAAAKKAAEEAERKAAEEAAARTREESARKAEAEAAKVREEAEKKAAAAAAAARQAQEEAELKARREQAARDAAEQEAQRKAEEEARAKAGASGAEGAPIQPAESATEAKKNRTGLIAAVAIILLAICGGGLYYFMQKSATQTPVAESPAPEPKVEAPKESGPNRADAKRRVGEFFAGKPDPAGAMKLAGELDTETPEQQDAVFRLYYYAAEADNPEAALHYAKCVDPTQPAWGTIKKDGADAWYYYGKSGDGAKARAELRDWTQKAAASGNAQAKAWLEKME